MRWSIILEFLQIKNFARVGCHVFWTSINAPARTPCDTTDKLRVLRYESHPPFSTVFSSNDYFLFLGLKKWVIEGKMETYTYFRSLKASFYRTDIEPDVHYNECILNGDYAEE